MPLGRMRSNCHEWRNRYLRPLYVLPFLFPAQDDIWKIHAEGLRQDLTVKRLYALLPRFELWDKPFADWTSDEWQTCGLSALRDISSGTVLWAYGAHPVDEMARIGKPFQELDPEKTE